jgi:hypothetical protein
LNLTRLDDPDASSSFNALNNAPFKIQYLDGSGANGTYFTDNFVLGDMTIENLQMGLGEASTINSGLMGIGYSKNVAAKKQYANIIDLLEEQGLISIKAYSLWLVCQALPVSQVPPTGQRALAGNFEFFADKRPVE